MEMETSFRDWLLRMGIKDHDDFIIPESKHKSIFLENYSTYPTFIPESSPTLLQESMEGLELQNLSSMTTTCSSSSSKNLISFGNPSSPPKQFHASNLSGCEMTNYGKVGAQKIINFGSPASVESPNSLGIKRSATEAAEHVMAERLRRQKLNHLFISLSALIPGRKKVDKASILQDAAEYIKKLEERLKVLEEETGINSEECNVKFTKNDENQTSDLNTDCSSNHLIMLPEIRVKVSGKNVLIGIHCEKQRGIILRIFGEIQKLDLIIVNCTVIQFGIDTFVVTVIAQMDVKFCMTTKDLVKELHTALLDII